MRYTKFFLYAYLIFGALFLYDAITKYVNTKEIAYASLLLGATAIFMFFFKRKFYKKFEKRNK